MTYGPTSITSKQPANTATAANKTTSPTHQSETHGSEPKSSSSPHLRRRLLQSTHERANLPVRHPLDRTPHLHSYSPSRSPAARKSAERDSIPPRQSQTPHHQMASQRQESQMPCLRTSRLPRSTAQPGQLGQRPPPMAPQMPNLRQIRPRQRMVAAQLDAPSPDRLHPGAQRPTRHQGDRPVGRPTPSTGRSNPTFPLQPRP